MWQRVRMAGGAAIALALACGPALAIEKTPADKASGEKPQADKSPAKFLYLDRSGHTDEPLKLKGDAAPEPAALTTPAAPGAAAPQTPVRTSINYVSRLGHNNVLNIGFGSSAVAQTNGAGRGFGIGPATQRSYNVGVNLGWRGATLAAGLMHDESNGSAYSGVDLTLGYSWSSWSTALQFANLASDDTPLAFGPYDNSRLYSLQLGAAYALTPGVTFSGGFKYQGFDPASPYQPSTKRQLLFLGTNINF